VYFQIAPDYDLLRVFGCPAYFHVKEDKLDPRVKKGLFIEFKKGIKGYKIWDPKDMNFIFSRDITFDETSMLKPKITQQVKIVKTKEVSQQVENDANPPSLESSVSLRIMSKVTQGNYQVAEVDADDDKDQE